MPIVSSIQGFLVSRKRSHVICIFFLTVPDNLCIVFPIVAVARREVAAEGEIGNRLERENRAKEGLRMYIEKIPNRNSRPAILLREGKRVGKRVVKETLPNLTNWPATAGC